MFVISLFSTDRVHLFTILANPFDPSHIRQGVRNQTESQVLQSSWLISVALFVELNRATNFVL